MTRRGWLLFAAMSLIWGVPYLLIKVAVKHLEPVVIVFGRTSIAAVLVLALAKRSGAVAAAARHWKLVLAFAAIEMAGPWFLLTNAEKSLPSGLTGLIVACVPMVGAIAAYLLGDHRALAPLRLVGIAVGLGGVALLVAHDLGGSDGIPWWSVAQMLLVCVGYATAPFIVARRLHDVPAMGVVAVSLTAVALVYAPLAWNARPDESPPAKVWWAVAALGGGVHRHRVHRVLQAHQRSRARARDVDHVRESRGRDRARRGRARREDHRGHRCRLLPRARRLLARHPTDATTGGCDLEPCDERSREADKLRAGFTYPRLPWPCRTRPGCARSR